MAGSAIPDSRLTTTTPRSVTGPYGPGVTTANELKNASIPSGVTAMSSAPWLRLNGIPSLMRPRPRRAGVDQRDLVPTLAELAEGDVELGAVRRHGDARGL